MNIEQGISNIEVGSFLLLPSKFDIPCSVVDIELCT